MGRQVNFFATEDDQRLILDRLHADGALVLRGKHHQDPPKFVPVMDLSDPFDALQLLLCRPQDQALVHFDKIVEAGHPFDGCYFVDVGVSPMIEWTLCRKKEAVLFSGRIWCETAFSRGSIKEKQDEGFLKWFGRIQRWIREEFFPTSNSMFLAGPSATSLHRRGLVQLRHLNEQISVL